MPRLSVGKNELMRWGGETRHLAVAGVTEFARLVGRQLLDRRQTEHYLATHGAAGDPAQLGMLNEAYCGKLEILRGGVVRAGGKLCLDFDYGNRTALSGWFGPAIEINRAAAVWSHYWMGYYHWIIDVLPKILLLKEKFGVDLGGVRICYPFAGESFETECLDLLKIPFACLLNTRDYASIGAKEIYCSPLPGWEIPSPAALAVRQQLIPYGRGSAGKRLYISRAGRRRCANEREVFALLNRYGFHFVEDVPRSIPEQIGMFHEAECIVAPHGAALTNLLWCRPQTKVLELVAGEYQPAYYCALSAMMGLDYQVLASTPRSQPHWTAMSNPIKVDLIALENSLARFFP